MGLLRQLRRAIGERKPSDISYSIEMCRCEACGATFESRTRSEHARCPECGSPEVRSVDSATTG